MLELTSDCFNEICGSTPVREQLGALDTNRQAALRRFWMLAAGGIVAAIIAFALLARSGLGQWGWIAGLLIVIVPACVGLGGLSRVSEALKRPVLEALAAKAGMEYLETGFSPPVYPEARKPLFGSWLSTETFTDLLHGKDEAGRNFAVYEANLVRGSGKNRHTVFQGQVYAVERSHPGGATTCIVPDRGLFNFFKPAAGMERVRIDSDPEFEKKFEVYSTGEMEARQLLFDPSFRARLLDMRKKGRVFVFVAPDNGLVAASGKNRFEPGSMFKSRGGGDRVRMMVDDVCDAIATLKEIRARLA